MHLIFNIELHQNKHLAVIHLLLETVMYIINSKASKNTDKSTLATIFNNLKMNIINCNIRHSVKNIVPN